MAELALEYFATDRLNSTGEVTAQWPALYS